MNNMIKSTVAKGIVAGMLLLGGNVMASEVSVKWSEPENYTDIVHSNEKKSNFEKRLFASFEKHFTRLGERLPEGYSWKITVTDLDLAGTVSNKYAPQQKDLRVLDDWFRPKIIFSYQVLNAQGSVVASKDDLVLQENMIERFPSTIFMKKEFSYEKHMIKQWFKKKLLPQISEAIF